VRFRRVTAVIGLQSRFSAKRHVARCSTTSMNHPYQLGEAYPVHCDTTMPSARLLRPIARKGTVRAVEPEVLLQPPFDKIEEHHQLQPLEHSLPTVGSCVQILVWDPQCAPASLASPELSFCVAPRLRPTTGVRTLNARDQCAAPHTRPRAS
jgi:hypothetical protein